MPTLTLDEITFRLHELADKLKRTHDLAERRTLLREFSRLLDQADKLNDARLRKPLWFDRPSTKPRA